MITGRDLMSTQYFILHSFLFLRILINDYVYAVENHLVLLDSKNPSSSTCIPSCVCNFVFTIIFINNCTISRTLKFQNLEQSKIKIHVFSSSVSFV